MILFESSIPAFRETISTYHVFVFSSDAIWGARCLFGAFRDFIFTPLEHLGHWDCFSKFLSLESKLETDMLFCEEPNLKPWIWNVRSFSALKTVLKMMRFLCCQQAWVFDVVVFCLKLLCIHFSIETICVVLFKKQYQFRTLKLDFVRIFSFSVSRFF